MTNERKISQAQYGNAAALLSMLFEFNSDIEQQINLYLQKYGIVYFFEHFEELELDYSTILRLQAVREVLFRLESEDARLKGGETGNA